MLEHQMNDSPISRIASVSARPPVQPSFRRPLPLIGPFGADPLLAGALETDELAHDEFVATAGLSHDAEPAFDYISVLHFSEVVLQRDECLCVIASRTMQHGCECLERVAQCLGSYSYPMEILFVGRSMCSAGRLAQPLPLAAGSRYEILDHHLVGVRRQWTADSNDGEVLERGGPVGIAEGGERALQRGTAIEAQPRHQCHNGRSIRHGHRNPEFLEAAEYHVEIANFAHDARKVPKLTLCRRQPVSIEDPFENS